MKIAFETVEPLTFIFSCDMWKKSIELNIKNKSEITKKKIRKKRKKNQINKTLVCISSFSVCSWLSSFKTKSFYTLHDFEEVFFSVVQKGIKTVFVSL